MLYVKLEPSLQIPDNVLSSVSSGICGKIANLECTAHWEETVNKPCLSKRDSNSLWFCAGKMANSRDLFECSICTQLLKDPVTTTCGHSFCMKCIYTYWDTKRNRRRTYSCPLCRETFNERPVLKRSTVLANLLEEYKKASSQGAAADDAAPGDAQCDICTERKRKASMFCQECLASYCQTHLEPHFSVPPLKKHRLMRASINIKESICGRHDKLKDIYCLTDQQFVCVMCALDEHKEHDIVSAETKRQELQVICI